MSTPLITIATVTYNAEATLQRTLDSVAGQDYANIEHLIIDGCSKDRTLELIQLYVENNSSKAFSVQHQIRLIREPDNGLYDAMNKAMQNAKGDYMVFLNAGDKLHCSDTITQIAERAFDEPAVIYGETDLVDNDGKYLRHRRLQAPKVLTWKSFLEGMLVCHQSFYVRTDLAKELPYNLKYRFSADFDWCIRLIKLADKQRLPFVNTGLVLTDYLSEGMTTQNHRASLFERMRIMAVHYGWLRTIYQHIWFVVRSLCKP